VLQGVARPRKTNRLQSPTNHSTQPDRNMAVPYPFSDDNGRPPVALKHQSESDFSEPREILLTVQSDSRSVRAGAHNSGDGNQPAFPRDRWCTMREEFVSYSFLGVTVAGLVLLCSGLLSLAFT
jgi:hypothetical protein